MSFLFTGRKFLETTRSPAPALVLTSGRLPALITTDNIAPSVPANVQATALSSSSIGVSWSASTDTGGSGLQGYRIYRNGSSTPLPFSGTATTYTDTGLTASTLYSYRITAFDAQGNESALSTAASATTQSASVVTAPQILYTDIIAGPTTGGENNLGWYLSIYGTDFGSASALGSTTKLFIGGVEVANYRELGLARNGRHQRITVQLGSLGGAADGAVLPIKLTVAGIDSNTDKTFTVRAGPIIFVDEVNGADANAGTIASPKKNMQTTGGNGQPSGGVINQTNTVVGTCVCLRGGAYSSATGMDRTWFRIWRTLGDINIRNYPGPILGHAPEVPHYAAPANYTGIAGNDTQRGQEGYGRRVSISGVWISLNSNNSNNDSCAPINMQSDSDGWRIVDNELGPAPLASANKAGGCAGNGDGIRILGNYIHDIAGQNGSQKENHALYLDGSNNAARNSEVGWNLIKNIPGGTGIQLYNNYGFQFTNIDIHDNWVENVGKYLINLADGAKSVRVWNNVFRDSVNEGLDFNTSETGLAISVTNNVFYNCCTTASGSNCMATNRWNATSGYIEIAHNIWVMSASRSSNGHDWWADDGNGAVITWKRNLYFDAKGVRTSKESSDATGLYGNPLFTTPYTDFHLSAGSPAINAATATVNFSPTTDFDSRTRPASGNTNKALGAYEPA